MTASMPIKALIMTAAMTCPLIAWSAPVSAETVIHPVAATLTRARIHVPGMDCTNRSCQTTVYFALRRVAGVTSIKFDDPRQDVLVSFNPAQTTTRALLHAIANAGYPGKLVGGAGA